MVDEIDSIARAVTPSDVRAAFVHPRSETVVAVLANGRVFVESPETGTWTEHAPVPGTVAASNYDYPEGKGGHLVVELPDEGEGVSSGEGGEDEEPGRGPPEIGGRGPGGLEEGDDPED